MKTTKSLLCLSSLIIFLGTILGACQTAPTPEPIVETFTARVGQVRLGSPRMPFVSNVTGTWISPDEATNPRYWARHLRQTVRFSDCLSELLAEPNRVLLEVGPGRTLATNSCMSST